MFRQVAKFASVGSEAFEDMGWFGLRGRGMPALKDAGPVVSQDAIDDHLVVESHGRITGQAEPHMNFSGRDGNLEDPQEPGTSRASAPRPRSSSPPHTPSPLPRASSAPALSEQSVSPPPRASSAPALLEQSAIRSRSVSSSSISSISSSSSSDSEFSSSSHDGYRYYMRGPGYELRSRKELPPGRSGDRQWRLYLREGRRRTLQEGPGLDPSYNPGLDSNNNVVGPRRWRNRYNRRSPPPLQLLQLSSSSESD